MTTETKNLKIFLRFITRYNLIRSLSEIDYKKSKGFISLLLKEDSSFIDVQILEHISLLLVELDWNDVQYGLSLLKEDIEVSIRKNEDELVQPMFE